MGIARPLAMLALGAAILGGCAEATSLVKLPEIGKLPERVLSKDEQQSKVNQMIAKGQNHRTEAVKEIEEDR